MASNGCALVNLFCVKDAAFYFEEYKFNIQIYNSTGKSRAVILYTIKDGKKMVVCCNDKHELHPVEMDIPRRIEGDAHQAVFYRKEISMSCYMFESSWYPSEFLGFEPDEDNHTLCKLVLRRRGDDEVDDTIEVILS